MGDRAGDHPGETAPPKQRGWLYRAVRWALAKWWWLEGSVLLLGLLTNILLFPLGQGLNQWGQGVKSQVASLLALPGTRPITFIVGVVVVLLLSIVGKLADRGLKRDEEEKHRRQQIATTKHAVTQVVGEPLAQLAVNMAEVREEIKKLTRQPPGVPPGLIAPTGLPRALSLIGRDEVLAELLGKLRRGDAMGVFAVEGMGGVGKTALAAEVVARLAEDQDAFPNGAAWIACEGLEGETGLADLWARVAQALRLEQVTSLTDPQARRAALGKALAQQHRMLLALDNVEPGLDADAVLDTLWVRGHTALLLTARQKVAPRRLRAIELAPLTPPDGAHLFRERLSQLDTARPTSQDEPTIPKLLEAVGGLPLAIELMASYAGVLRLALEGVLREVEQDGLHAAAFHLDPKRALLARFERSWQVLTRDQQRLFAGLSLLAGASFPRTAALEIAQAAAPAKHSANSNDNLLRLVSYALVEALPGGERLRLHPLLREYADQKLKTLSPAQQVRLGEVMVAYWQKYAQAHSDYEGMDTLEAEAVGVMSALTWSHEHHQYQSVLTLVHALRRAWDVRGRRDEQLRMHVWAKSAAQQLGDLAEQCWTERELARIQMRLGALQEAHAGYERALELARQLRDREVERRAVTGLAELNGRLGKLSEARAGYEYVLEQLNDPLEDPIAAQAALNGLARLNMWMGQVDQARKWSEQALDLAHQRGNPQAEWSEIHALAELDRRTGRPAEARRGFEQALKLAQKLGDLGAERLGVRGLARLEAADGRLEEAREGFKRALTLARQVGEPAAIAVELCHLGTFIGLHGEPEEGYRLVKESLVLCEQLNDIYTMGRCHRFLAWFAQEAGQRMEAIDHYLKAVHCFEQVHSPDAEQVRADLRRLEENEYQEGQ